MILQTLQTFLEGGWVMYPLSLMAMLLWYGLAQRWYLLQQPKELEMFPNRRQLMSYIKNTKPMPQVYKEESFVGQAIVRAQELFVSQPRDVELSIETQIMPICQQASQFRSMVKSCVAVTPLLGLLGTVMGMIETFDALADNVLYSQSGGIASGISQALLTTEYGLVIAVPGLVLSKYLENKEEQICTRVEQVAEQLKIVCIEGEVS